MYGKHMHTPAFPVSLTILALCVMRGLCSSPFLRHQSFPRAAAAAGTLWEVACHKPHLGLLAERRLSKSKIMFLIKSSPGWCIMVDEFPEATEACLLLPCAWYSCCSSKAEQMKFRAISTGVLRVETGAFLYLRGKRKVMQRPRIQSYLRNQGISSSCLWT